MKIDGFTLVKETSVKELSSKVRLWQHDKTGAEILSFLNADENKVFGVSFRTPPADSTGVAHILEHSVLCGSDKYPVKEPFVELLKGSLQTFLNAFTYPDKTCYPVASTNLADFRNLTDVYLDAVFFPLITENIFKQEGWHLEAESIASPLKYKGVVYNEMKGAFSSPESVLGRYSLHALFPDTVYGLESGGDPKDIPNLTYESFKNFHADYYHPSNARFFFWGDDKEEERLEQLDAVLAKFEKKNVNSVIEKQKHFLEPRTETVSFAASEDEKGMVVVNWLLSDVTDVELTLALRMLEHILLGMPASPLRRKLIESGLGEDIAGQGLEAELLQLTFDVGLKGVNVADARKIQELIINTLAELINEGFGQEAVEAALNSVEFSLRENNSGRFPVGLSVMLRALTTWLHDADPLLPLQFEEPLANIKKRLAAGEKYFENLLKCWLLENKHRVTVVLAPDKTLGARQEQEEKDRLADIAEKLAPEELGAIVEAAENLQTWQGTPDSEQALASIPRLGLADLPKKNTEIPCNVFNKGIPVFFHPLATSGIAYVDVCFDLCSVPEQLLPLLGLFGRALLEMGTKKRDFVDLNLNIARKTGGMDADSFFISHIDGARPVAQFCLSGKVAPDKIKELFVIMEEVLLLCNFADKQRFLSMVLEEKARSEHSIIPSGHTVVGTRLRAGFSPAGWLGEMVNGVEALFSLRVLQKRIEENWEEVLQDLETLRELVFNSATMQVNITALAEQEIMLTEQAQMLAKKLPLVQNEKAVWSYVFNKDNEALIMPAQVNYVGKGLNLFANGYKWHGSALVIMKYLRTGFLWEKVRVQGGAYGCMCGLDRMSGTFFLVSYRDPNILPTLEVYDKVAEHLAGIRLSRQELEASIVGAIGELDTYLLPDAKGSASFTRMLVGDTLETRQRLRDEVLSTKVEDMHNFGQYLEAFTKKGQICALGGAALERVATEKGWQQVKIL